MFLGRVVLPLAGLGLAAALVWNSSLRGRLELPALPGLENDSSILPTTAPPAAAADGGQADASGALTTIVAEGRVVAYPGAQVIVGAETTGTIIRVPVVEKAVVKRGDLLVEFRSDELRAQVDEAAARVAEVEADIARAEADFQRAEALLARNAGPRQDYDRARFSLQALRARRDAMAAAHNRLVAQLVRYRVVAPIDGVITARMAQPGETIAAATPLMTIADLRRIRIEAEVDEYDIAHCHAGRPVKITAEGYPGRSWRGEVEEIADVLIARRIRPEDPGKPTDTRVLPVRVALREPTPLRLGQRVEVEIERNAETPGEPPPAPGSSSNGVLAPGSGERR
jgi:RND family efflux transporter MFP subunit